MGAPVYLGWRTHQNEGQGEVQTKNSFSLVVVELLDPGYVSMGSRIYFRPGSAGFKALDFISLDGKA